MRLRFTRKTETLIEISKMFYEKCGQKRILKSVDTGSTGMKRKLVEWANEFEDQNRCTNWRSTDYFARLEEFIEGKIRVMIGERV